MNPHKLDLDLDIDLTKNHTFLTPQTLLLETAHISLAFKTPLMHENKSDRIHLCSEKPKFDLYLY